MKKLLLVCFILILFSRCEKDPTIESNIPTISTGIVTNITFSSATISVDNEMYYKSAGYGIIYSTTDKFSNAINIEGKYNSSLLIITGLVQNTKYFYKAYVTDGVSYTYGDTKTFTTSNYPTITTKTATYISDSYAIVDMTISNLSNLKECGILYLSGTTTPTYNNAIKVSSDYCQLSNSFSLTELVGSTVYSYRAYATDGINYFYGSTKTFTTLSPYCTSKGIIVTYEWISQVRFTGVNHSTSSVGGYADYTNLVGTATKGKYCEIAYKAGFKSSLYTEYWAVWIDFNQNRVFDDDEQVVSRFSALSTILTSSVYIPTTALSGRTRMRVSMKRTSNQTACETFTYGEVEDYSVIIQ